MWANTQPNLNMSPTSVAKCHKVYQSVESLQYFPASCIPNAISLQKPSKIDSVEHFYQPAKSKQCKNQLWIPCIIISTYKTKNIILNHKKLQRLIR
jgi:hypothetical protein